MTLKPDPQPSKKNPHPLKPFQKIIREWKRYLTAPEYIVLIELADHTWGWGRSTDTISGSKLIEGNAMYAGLGCLMHRATMFRALKSLEAKHFVFREGRHRRSSRFTVNKNWHPDLLISTDGTPLVSHDATISSHHATCEVAECDTIEGNSDKVTLEKVTPTALAPPRGITTPDDLVREAIAGHHQNLSARRVSAKTLLQQCEAAWREACHEAHPTMLVTKWSMKAQGMIKAKACNWLHQSKIAFPDFLDWSVRNWTAIMTRQFKWMKKDQPPTVPDLMFFIRFVDDFAECWSADRLKDWISDKDRTEVERLRSQGMADDEIGVAIGRKRATEALRDEMAKSEQESRARLRRAQISEKRAERLERQAAVPAPPRRRRPDPSETYKVPDVDWANLPTLDPNWEPPE